MVWIKTTENYSLNEPKERGQWIALSSTRSLHLIITLINNDSRSFLNQDVQFVILAHLSAKWWWLWDFIIHRVILAHCNIGLWVCLNWVWKVVIVSRKPQNFTLDRCSTPSKTSSHVSMSWKTTSMTRRTIPFTPSERAPWPSHFPACSNSSFATRDCTLRYIWEHGNVGHYMCR